MRIRSIIGMGFVPSTLSILLHINIFTQLVDQVLSHSVLKDLMMMSPEWVGSEDVTETEFVQRRARTAITINPLDWSFSGKRCKPICRQGTPVDICYDPPTRKELCKVLNNADWCCQEWVYEKPNTLYFLPNCEVACVAYSPCPYSTCRRCAEINNNHHCCKNINCTAGHRFTSPDGTKLDIWTRNVPADDTSVSQPADTCPDATDTICKNFNGDPVSCRLVNGCAYNCGTGTCHNSGSVYGQPCYDSCFNHCADKCGCTGRPGCVWKAAKGSCKTSMNKHCHLTSFPGKECSRKGAYYSVGGILCESLVQKGDCEFDFAVVAINLGSDKAVTDRDGIEYRPEAEANKEDPFGISHAVAFTPADIKTGNANDQELYATAVTGEATTCRNESLRCIHYIIPTMTWDGDYELALRMVEGNYTEKLKRRFSVKFDGEQVLSEFDVLSYAEEKFRPIDVYINFKISQKGKLITVKGFKSRPVNTTAKLSLCHADCGEDTSFIMSAFHIIKQKKFIPRDPCIEIPVPECEDYQFDPDDCERSEGNATFYAFGGKFCRNRIPGRNTPRNCAKQQIIKAINLNGLPLVDSRGIAYEQDMDDNHNIGDADAIQRGRDSYREATGYLHSKDRDLYNTLVYGDLGKLQQCSEACKRYEFSLNGDGNYELAVRTADDESEGPGQRKFSVLLGNISVFPEVDLFHLTGKKSQAVDLTLNFEVTDNGTNLRLKGFTSQEDDVVKLSSEQTVQLSFCPSMCNNADTRTWLVGSFSVVSFNIREPVINATCASFDGDACGCIGTTFCDYNVTSTGCRQRMGECDPPLPNQCRRKGAFGQNMYSIGGILCTNSKVHSCPPSTTVIGVNFGASTPLIHTDVDGIEYKKDKGIPFTGPDNLKIIKAGKPKFLETGFSSKDLPLYHPYLFINSNHTNTCITYYVPSKGNGLYELAILTGASYFTKVKEREFRFFFNDVPIVASFEPAQYRLPPLGFSLRVNYKVFGDADRVQMEGYIASDIKHASKQIPFSICHGECNYGSGKPTISAFAVTKYRDELACSEFNNHPCGCRTQRCEYNVQSDQCIEGKTVCSHRRENFDECRRGGSYIYYAYAGEVCPSPVTSGNCTIEKVLLAVNLGDKATTHKDVNGIDYVPITDVLFEDLDKTRATYPGGSRNLHAGVPKADLPLYQLYDWGRDKTASSSNPRCLKFFVPTAGDGEYEISIKTGESWWKDPPPRRSFSFKLNGRYIVREFVPAQYAGVPNAIDLNANFRIAEAGTKFELRGHQSNTITTGDTSIPFEACIGQCSWDYAVKEWILGAFSVVKLKKSITCASFHGDPCACRYYGHCQYNVIYNKCVETVDACAGNCGSGNECHRGGDTIFYVRAGLICPSSVSFGNCEVEKTMLAVNFFGPEHTDKNGIVFQSDAMVPFEDPYQVRKNGSSHIRKMPVEGVPLVDLVLYNTSMFSATYQDVATCVTYHVPTDGEGHYELGVKFAEVFWTAAGMREFSYYINNQTVVQSLDMAAVRDGPNKGFDLLTNFKVISGFKSTLQMSGYPESVITSADNSIPLTFCPGTCECPPFKDRNFQVAAMSVVKFKTVPGPRGRS